jgi:hypothetical protein
MKKKISTTETAEKKKGTMEYWKNGIMDERRFFAIRWNHDSIIPAFQFVFSVCSATSVVKLSIEPGLKAALRWNPS